MFKTAKLSPILLPVLLVAYALAGTIEISANQRDNVSAAMTQTRDTPIFSSYKGVTIGMTLEEVRDKLGKPKEPSEALDYYAPSDNEYIQIYYDAKKVSAITVTFSGTLAPTITWLGADPTATFIFAG